MLARAEFTVRPRHLNRVMSLDSRLHGNDWLLFGYNDAGYPTLWMDSRWMLLCYDNQGTRNEYMPPDDAAGSHKCVGEIMEYWSATPYAGNATNAWNVNFNNGNDNANNKSNNNYVRLVRGGEWIA